MVNGLGSGVVIGRDGDIVTNYHVVQDATELEIALVDGTVLPRRVLGVDPESDIALLHVDAPGLQPIAIADIEDVQPGDVVLAIGNPLGIGQSVSQGIVSAVVRKGSRPSRTSSRPTPRSTPATPAVRWSTPRDASWASTC